LLAAGAMATCADFSVLPPEIEVLFDAPRA
jgi:hypothetical protein